MAYLIWHVSGITDLQKVNHNKEGQMLAKAENTEPMFGSTPRTRRLKANRVYPGIADEAVEYTSDQRTEGQVNYLKELKTHIRTYDKICPERARYFTDAYKAADGELEAIRFAKGIASIFDNMTIYIEDEELIVGNYASSPTSMPIYPEYFTSWISDAISEEGMFHDRVTDEECQELLDINDYWEDKCYDARMYAATPPSLKDYEFFNGLTLTTEVYSAHAAVCSGFENLFAQGANGVLKRCRDKLAELDEEGVTGDMSVSDYIEKKANLQAMIIANEAFARFGKRYAKLAREKAATETDPTRKKDLEKVAEVCDRVPAEPPRTLHEALQAFYFFHMIQAVIATRALGCAVRFDTMFNSYYQKDKEAERITREEALELIECLWVKIESISCIRSPENEAVSSGSSQFQTFTLGGTLEDDSDASNEMSILAIEASMSVHTIQPTLVVRYHENISPRLIDKAIDCIHSGLGFPAFLNDKPGLPMLESRGVPKEDSWNWACPSCVSSTIPNKNMRQSSATMGMLSLGKCLHLALNDGYDSFLGKQLGAHTGDARDFKSIEDVKAAYLKQVDHAMSKLTPINHIGEETWKRWVKRPFISPYLDECIERASLVNDFAAYETYNCPEIQIAGAINAADSLMVLKKLVFEEETITMEELQDAMKNNWEGKEELRQRCLNVPKYGNDNDEVDELAKWVHSETNGVMCQFLDYWGMPARSQGGLMSAYYSFGRACQATPDGRMMSEPLADGTASPMAGRDLYGPTATLQSLAKIDVALGNEMLCNQKFMPTFLEGENKEIFANYLRTWYDLGAWHVQFNVVDKGTLLDAQKVPESYPDLVVRVAGYSAYFVDLGRPMQDDIISRTEQSFGQGC